MDARAGGGPRTESPRRIQPFSPLKELRIEQMRSSSLKTPQSSVSRNASLDATIFKTIRLPLTGNGQSHATGPIAQHAWRH